MILLGKVYLTLPAAPLSPPVVRVVAPNRATRHSTKKMLLALILQASAETFCACCKALPAASPRPQGRKFAMERNSRTADRLLQLPQI